MVDCNIISTDILKTVKKEINASYDRVITKTKAETKSIWVHDSCYDIISRNAIQADALHSSANSGKELALRL